jgi:hypothetical protein
VTWLPCRVNRDDASSGLRTQKEILPPSPPCPSRPTFPPDPADAPHMNQKRCVLRDWDSTCYVTHSFCGVVAATGRGISSIVRVQLSLFHRGYYSALTSRDRLCTYNGVSVANYARIAVAKVVSIAV